MPRRSPRWILAGRVVFVALIFVLAGYLFSVGLDKADKIASAVGVVLAFAALFAPYLLPAQERPVTEPDRAEHTGQAVASAGGNANTGLRAGGTGRPASVNNTGPATARGPSSKANTGIVREADAQR